MPLPWRYDTETKNVIADDGAIVCRVGDSVHADPAVGNAICDAMNSKAHLLQALEQCVTEAQAHCLNEGTREALFRRIEAINQTARYAIANVRWVTNPVT